MCSYPTVRLEGDGGRSHWSSHHHPRTVLEKVKACESCGPISQSPVELSAFLYPDHFNVRFFLHKQRQDILLEKDLIS